jgi:hypothetical protein
MAKLWSSGKKFLVHERLAQPQSSLTGRIKEVAEGSMTLEASNLSARL